MKTQKPYYFTVAIDVHPHTHPLYVARMIRERLEALGMPSNTYSEHVAIYEDLDAELEDATLKLNSDSEWTMAYQFELEKKYNSLTEAKAALAWS